MGPAGPSDSHFNRSSFWCVRDNPQASVIWWTDRQTHCQCVRTLKQTPLTSLLPTAKQTNRQSRIQCPNKISHPWEITKKNCCGEMPLRQIFFYAYGLTDCLFARPLIWRGCIEGTSMERKWHKSRVKLNVLTVSGPLWPCGAPPLSPVWVHHSSAEWGLLAQHLCQTTAALASAPHPPRFPSQPLRVSRPD